MWRAVDANGQMIDFRLTTKRDAKAAKAFFE
nr:DDE-type integrase/transposase/recombinase [Monaibacterium marinum]